jgi:hypothetical protein
MQAQPLGDLVHRKEFLRAFPRELAAHIAILPHTTVPARQLLPIITYFKPISRP